MALLRFPRVQKGVVQGRSCSPGADERTHRDPY